MFCKVFIDNSKNKNSIIQYLKKDKSDFLIITQDECAPLNNHNIKTILELIPEISEKNSLAINSAADKLSKYNQILNKIKFRNIPIFDILENFLIEELIFIEKIKLILQKKENIIFLFKEISFSCFSILKIAKEAGYDIEENFALTVISDKKVEKLDVFDNFESIEKRIKLKTVKSLFSNSKMELGKMVIKHAMNKFKNFDESKILQSIDKKIHEKSFETIFFLSTDIDDFLIPYYKIIKKCNHKKMKFMTVSVDLTTRKHLKKHNIEFLDLFEEVYMIRRIIKNSDEFNELCKIIENRCKVDYNYILNIEKMSSFIQARISHLLSIAIVVIHILKKYHPNSACIGIDGSALSNIVTSCSNQFKINTLSIEPGILNEGLERKNNYKANKICIYGNQGAKVLSNLGYDKNRIFVTGNPRYDDLVNSDSSDLIDELIQKYNMKKGTKKIIIAMSRWHENDDAWIHELVTRCSKKNYEIIIKTHPIYETQNLGMNEKFLKLIKNKCKAQKIPIISDINSSKLLSIADIVITDYSNVGIEAMLRKIPVITVNFADENTKYMQKFHETKLAIHVKTIDELNDVIDKILKQTKKYANQNIEKIGELYNFKNDGNATERVYKLLIKGD